jgi:hypothetical protein
MEGSGVGERQAVWVAPEIPQVEWVKGARDELPVSLAACSLRLGYSVGAKRCQYA